MEPLEGRKNYWDITAAQHCNNQNGEISTSQTVLSDRKQRADPGITSASRHEPGYNGLVQQVSLRQTWCVILSLVSVWSSPLCDMSVCPSLTSATAD